jgi:HK97 family phage major capsid protein
MGKKYIIVSGKKVYLKDGENPEVQDEDVEPNEEVPTGEVSEEETKPEEKPEEGIDEKVNDVSEKIANSIRAKLGIDKISDLNEKVSKLADNQTKGNSKIMEILSGKDLSTNKSKLTKEEKIVGFYHALMQGDKAVCKALSEGTAADGGYLFPDEFRAELVRWLADQNRMRGLVRVIPMRRDVLKAPSLLNTVKVYWTAENAAKTTSTAAFGEITLTARKVAAILYASDELVEDSTELDVVNLIIELFGEAIANEEDRVIVAGNGTTEPTGIITAGTLRTVVCSGNLSFDNIINLVYALPQKYHRNASFLVHRTNIKELRMLKDTNGRYLWQDPISAEGAPTLMGYPVYENNWVGEANILFGDWKMCYWLGDRKSMTVKVSNDTETAFTHDQTAIRVVSRIGGNVVLADAGAELTTIP